MNRDEILELSDIIGNGSVDPTGKGLFPVSKSTWYRGIKMGLYPRPIQLSRRRVGWLRHDIEALISALLAMNASISPNGDASRVTHRQDGDSSDRGVV